MIHLENINKTYHNGAPLHVLKGINLDIERGEFVSIMGAPDSRFILSFGAGVLLYLPGRPALGCGLSLIHIFRGCVPKS